MRFNTVHTALSPTSSLFSEEKPAGLLDSRPEQTRRVADASLKRLRVEERRKGSAPCLRRTRNRLRALQPSPGSSPKSRGSFPYLKAERSSTWTTISAHLTSNSPRKTCSRSMPTDAWASRYRLPWPKWEYNLKSC